MTELSQQTQTRIMTDIAFGEARAAAAAFSLAVAEEQSQKRDERRDGTRDAFVGRKLELTH